MKKVLVLILMILGICSCSKVDKDSLIKDFTKKINDSKSYETVGTMEIRGDEDTYSYSVNTAYKKNSNFRVDLTNLINNHEQILLKNESAVYVVTPSLNKSFKFQSEWPYNSSQAYLLSSLVNDIENDDKIVFEEKDDYYILKVKVNYPNNSELTYEKIYFDKNNELKKVEVCSEDNNIKIVVTFSKIDLNASIDDEHFKIENLVKEDLQIEENTTPTIENIVYPLYLPSDTFLSNKETISTDNGQRVILTFGGDKSFVLVEETINIPKEFEVVPVYGDPLILNDVVAAMSVNSLNWNYDNIEYYLSSTTLTNDEMLLVAGSLNNAKSVLKEQK